MASLSVALVPAFIGFALAPFLAPQIGFVGGALVAGAGGAVTLVLVALWERRA